MEHLLTFKYITRNIRGDEHVDAADFDEDLIGCDCEDGQCTSAQKCTCLQLSGGQRHYNDAGALLADLMVDDANKPIFECCGNCACYSSAMPCRNRIVQCGESAKITVFYTGEADVGYGLRATAQILRGEFVVEYVGEVISRSSVKSRFSARNRAECNSLSQHNYIFTLNEFFKSAYHRTYIDARHYGNLSRFINHSCAPNLRPQIVRIGALTPRLALFAIRQIEPGEQLSYDYGINTSPSLNDTITSNTTTTSSSSAVTAATTIARASKACLCGAPNCRRILPSFFGDNL